MCQHRLYRNIWRVLTDIYGQTVALRFETLAKALQSDVTPAA
jgi:hypothetical protein